METEAKKFRILLVEDNRADVYLFRAALETRSKGYDLSVVSSGVEAWRYLNEHSSNGERPDLVVLDLNLPGLSGRQILTNVGERPQLVKIPIAVFTGSLLDDEIESDYPNLRLLYMRKTPDFDELVEIVGQFIEFAKGTVAA